jgi:ankyrin repeat protein
VVTLLVEAGADANVLNPDTGSSALHHAAARCSLAATRLLVQRGADVGKRGANGETPLHEAAHYGSREVIDNFYNKYGYSIFYCIVSFELLKIPI